MGFFSDLGSAISGFVSSVCSVVKDTVSSIGRALVTGGVKLLELAGNTIESVCNTIRRVGVSLGIINENDDIDELGDKAMNADKKPEDFEYISEYIQYLKNEVAFDKESFKKLEDKDKLARKVVGATIVSKGIQEDKGINIPEEYWVEVDKQKMDKEEINGIIDMFKNNRIDNNFADFCKGKLDFNEEKKIGGLLVDMYKELEPSMSIEDIEDKIMNMETVSIEGAK